MTALAEDGAIGARIVAEVERQQNEEWLSPADAAKILKISTKTLKAWEARGIVSARRIPNGHRRFWRADIERLLT